MRDLVSRHLTDQPWAALGGLLALLGLLAAGCYTGTGSYPVEVFTEMHYQQSFRPEEPPRLLPAPDSVPRTIPEPQFQGEQLFDVNCAMCHGPAGRGDGPVLVTMITEYGYQPALDPNLASPAVQELPDEAISSFISQGVVVMPPFQDLLSDQEIRLLVQYIRRLPQQQR